MTERIVMGDLMHMLAQERIEQLRREAAGELRARRPLEDASGRRRRTNEAHPVLRQLGVALRPLRLARNAERGAEPGR